MIYLDKKKKESINCIVIDDIGKDVRGDVRWGVIWIIIMGLGVVVLGVYIDYKYRIWVCFLKIIFV